MILDVNDQEMDIIMRALMTQPWMQVHVVISKLTFQANAQKQAQVPAQVPQAPQVVQGANGGSN